MKSFRIVDTKFRILSKGRVGMFASIAVGMMVSAGLPSVANAADYAGYVGTSIDHWNENTDVVFTGDTFVNGDVDALYTDNGIDPDILNDVVINTEDTEVTVNGNVSADTIYFNDSDASLTVYGDINADINFNGEDYTYVGLRGDLYGDVVSGDTVAWNDTNDDYFAGTLSLDGGELADDNVQYVTGNIGSYRERHYREYEDNALIDQEDDFDRYFLSNVYFGADNAATVFEGHVFTEDLESIAQGTTTFEGKVWAADSIYIDDNDGDSSHLVSTVTFEDDVKANDIFIIGDTVNEAFRTTVTFEKTVDVSDSVFISDAVVTFAGSAGDSSWGFYTDELFTPEYTSTHYGVYVENNMGILDSVVTFTGSESTGSDGHVAVYIGDTLYADNSTVTFGVVNGEDNTISSATSLEVGMIDISDSTVRFGGTVNVDDSIRINDDETVNGIASTVTFEKALTVGNDVYIDGNNSDSAVTSVTFNDSVSIGEDLIAYNATLSFTGSTLAGDDAVVEVGLDNSDGGIYFSDSTVTFGTVGEDGSISGDTSVAARYIEISDSAVRFGGTVTTINDLRVEDDDSASVVTFEKALTVGESLYVYGETSDGATTTVTFKDSVNVTNDANINDAIADFTGANTEDVKAVTIGGDFTIDNSTVTFGTVGSDATITDTTGLEVAGQYLTITNGSTVRFGSTVDMTNESDFGSDSMTLGIYSGSNVTFEGAVELHNPFSSIIEISDAALVTFNDSVTILGESEELDIRIRDTASDSTITQVAFNGAVNISGDIEIDGNNNIEIDDTTRVAFTSTVNVGGDIDVSDAIVTFTGVDTEEGSAVVMGDDLNINDSFVAFGSIQGLEEGASFSDTIIAHMQITQGNPAYTLSTTTSVDVAEEINICDSAVFFGGQVTAGESVAIEESTVIFSGVETEERAAVVIGGDLDIEYSMVAFGTMGEDAMSADTSVAVAGNVDISDGSYVLFGSTLTVAEGDASDGYIDISDSQVYFGGDVTVGAVHGSDGAIIDQGTVYISQSQVELDADMYAHVEFYDGSDGVMKVTDNHVIYGDANGYGTIDFEGSTTLAGSFGEDSQLKEVIFGSKVAGSMTDIDRDIYADTVTIGGDNNAFVEGEDGSALIRASVNPLELDYAPTVSLQEWRNGSSVVNVTADMTFGGDLVINDETAAINFRASHVTIDNDFYTNNGAMSFIVDTRDITIGEDAVADNANSGFVQVSDSLFMQGEEKFHINYVGSLSGSGTYTLIEADSIDGASDGSGFSVTDNSFVIDSVVNVDYDSGEIVLSAARAVGDNAADELYVVKSGTEGHFSNNAAYVIAGIAADGSQSTPEMIELIQKLEIDDYGFVTGEESLANEVKKLAPIVNSSFSHSSLSTNTLVMNTVSNRIADMRGDSRGLSSGDEELSKGAWIKLLGATATQDKDGMYDGFKTRTTGFAMGMDKTFSNDVVAGMSFGYTRSKIEQQDFRAGDEANTDSYQVVGYVSQEIGDAYVEGAVSYARHNTDAKRAAAVGETAKADIDATQYSARIGAGYRYNIDKSMTLTPYATIDYNHLTQDAYSETGALSALSVDEYKTDRVGLAAGVRLSTQYEVDTTVLRPEFKVGVQHYAGMDNNDVTAQYVYGNGDKFVTPGSKLDSTMLNFGLGLKAEISKTSSIGLTVDYDRSADGLFEGYTGQLVGRIEF